MRVTHSAYQCHDSLQHTATLCNTLQHPATHCNTLQHTAIHCNTPQHTATHCNTLQHTAIHCNTLQLTATHYNTLQHTGNNIYVLQPCRGNKCDDVQCWGAPYLAFDLGCDMTHSYHVFFAYGSFVNVYMVYCSFVWRALLIHMGGHDSILCAI